MPWGRHVGASDGNLPYRSRVCLEGVPAHARQIDAVLHLLPKRSFVEEIDYTREKEDEMGCFVLWIWCKDPDALAVQGSLEIQQPEVLLEEYYGGTPVNFVRSEALAVLKYDVLIHLDRVEDYSPNEETMPEWPAKHNFIWHLGQPDVLPDLPRVSVHSRLGERRDRSSPRGGGQGGFRHVPPPNQFDTSRSIFGGAATNAQRGNGTGSQGRYWGHCSEAQDKRECGLGEDVTAGKQKVYEVTGRKKTQPSMVQREQGSFTAEDQAGHAAGNLGNMRRQAPNAKTCKGSHQGHDLLLKAMEKEYCEHPAVQSQFTDPMLDEVQQQFSTEAPSQEQRVQHQIQMEVQHQAQTEVPQGDNEDDVLGQSNVEEGEFLQDEARVGAEKEACSQMEQAQEEGIVGQRAEFTEHTFDLNLLFDDPDVGPQAGFVGEPETVSVPDASDVLELPTEVPDARNRASARCVSFFTMPLKRSLLCNPVIRSKTLHHKKKNPSAEGSTSFNRSASNGAVKGTIEEQAAALLIRNSGIVAGSAQIKDGDLQRFGEQFVTSMPVDLEGSMRQTFGLPSQGEDDYLGPLMIDAEA
ncbi:unnamed protein product [Urochloa humidicola]